jgi:hypothetical protein
MVRKRIRGTGDYQQLATAGKTQLEAIPSKLPSSASELRARVLEFVSISRVHKEMALFHVRAVLPYNSAAERILEYLRLFVGKPVQGEELEIVSGISEYARRVREWRVEFGFPIVHSKNTYTLERAEPDASKAELWRTLNRIRRTEAGGTERMRLLFLALPVGTIVKTSQLKYVIEDGDMRRVRELRTELGYRIMTQKTGMPNLKKDEYVLVDREPVAEHDRKIEKKTMIAVLERDRQRCRKCGWRPDQRIAGDPRQYVEFHHMTWHMEGGANDAENLITLCNVDHKEVHRLKLDKKQLEKWLKEQ